MLPTFRGIDPEYTEVAERSEVEGRGAGAGARKGRRDEESETVTTKHE